MRHTRGCLHLHYAHACNGRGRALARAYEWAGFLTRREVDGPNVNTGRKKKIQKGRKDTDTPDKKTKSELRSELDEKFVRRNFTSLLLGIDIEVYI